MKNSTIKKIKQHEWPLQLLKTRTSKRRKKAKRKKKERKVQKGVFFEEDFVMRESLFSDENFFLGDEAILCPDGIWRQQREILLRY